LGASVGALVLDRTEAYRSVDLTSVVRQEAAGAGATISVGLSQDAVFDGTIGLRAQFTTRESVSKPYLQVVLAPTGG
jgi:hypothetical protein